MVPATLSKRGTGRKEAHVKGCPTLHAVVPAHGCPLCRQNLKRKKRNSPTLHTEYLFFFLKSSLLALELYGWTQTAMPASTLKTENLSMQTFIPRLVVRRKKKILHFGEEPDQGSRRRIKDGGRAGTRKTKKTGSWLSCF